MAVEVEVYNLKRRGEDILEKSADVPPGSTKNINFSKKRGIGVVTFCDVEDAKGAVFVVGQALNKKVSVVLFEDENDERGKRVSAHGFIPIKKGQTLSLLLKRKPRKELIFSMDSGGDDDQEGVEILQNSPAGVAY